MATEIKLPVLGENVDSGDVAKILVAVGDQIDKDQPILELETDKATVEVPAFASGVVREIHVKEGEKVKVGQVILTVETGTNGQKTPAETRPEEELEKYAEAQDQSSEEQEAAEEVEAEAEPAVVEQEAKPDTKERAARPSERAETAEPVRAARPALQTGEAKELAPAAPSIRRMARELGVEINEVKGTGPGSRISEEDVRNYARSIIVNASASKVSASPFVSVPLPDFSQWGEIERKPMSAVRRKTAESMRNSWLSSPRVTQFDQADITDLERLREKFGKRAESMGGKLTVTAIALKIAASALKVFPQFNASIDVENEEIIYKKYYNIGVAVDTERGLLVPVIRDVDKKNILELAAELNEAAQKARNKKLSLDEMQGATFTITNLGGIGGTGFTPIVNVPEVAILGISRASMQPVYINGEFQPRLILPLTLSYDHRLIDGANAARFLRWVAEALQQPFLLVLEG